MGWYPLKNIIENHKEKVEIKQAAKTERAEIKYNSYNVAYQTGTTPVTPGANIATSIASTLGKTASSIYGRGVDPTAATYSGGSTLYIGIAAIALIFIMFLKGK